MGKKQIKCREEASQELWHSFRHRASPRVDYMGMFIFKDMTRDIAGRAGKRAPSQGRHCG